MSIRKADWISMNGKLLNICLCALLCVACKERTGRFYSIYSFRNGVIDYLKSITTESLGSPSLFSFYDGRLYYIINEISGEDEHYELRQLEI